MRPILRYKNGMLQAVLQIPNLIQNGTCWPDWKAKSARQPSKAEIAEYRRLNKINVLQRITGASLFVLSNLRR